MTICSKLPSLQAHLAAQRKHWQGCRAWLVRIWSKMRGTRWGARKPNDEANFHTFCIIWDVIFLFRKYIRIYRNLTNRNMIPKFGKWYSYMFLFFDGKRPNGIGQRICNLRWCHHTWSLRRLATKLCFQYIQTRSSFLFCFTHIYNVWNILMAYIWFMQWLVQILYPYIYIYIYICIYLELSGLGPGWTFSHPLRSDGLDLFRDRWGRLSLHGMYPVSPAFACTMRLGLGLEAGYPERPQILAHFSIDHPLFVGTQLWPTPI